MLAVYPCLNDSAASGTWGLLKTYSESTPKELSNGSLPCEFQRGIAVKLVLPVHFSIEKLCRVTCHMITLNACPSSSVSTDDGDTARGLGSDGHVAVCS